MWNSFMNLTPSTVRFATVARIYAVKAHRSGAAAAASKGFKSAPGQDRPKITTST
jgi:hypothetical protein